jgi:hypothetical protein
MDLATQPRMLQLDCDEVENPENLTIVENNEEQAEGDRY